MQSLADHLFGRMLQIVTGDLLSSPGIGSNPYERKQSEPAYIFHHLSEMRWFLLLLHSSSYKKCFSCGCLWILGARKANTLSFTASGSDSCRTSCDTLREDPRLHDPARSISLIKKESSKPNPKPERASVSRIQNWSLLPQERGPIASSHSTFRNSRNRK